MEFNPADFIEAKIQEIREQVDGRAILALSGGVDSSAVALLAHKAIGENLLPVFIDNGLMRHKEAEEIVSVFKDFGISVKVIDASEEFFNILKGIEDPEEKRKAFRDTFYTVFGRIVKESETSHLLQGTIAADIIETRGGIKTQHNILEQIGIDPETYGFKIIEPLKEIYKHEVREVAKELGLPEQIHQRMPFPGPGLATRVVGEVTPERVEIVKKATKIVEEEIKDLKPFQAFAVLLNDKATGMINSERKFGNIIVIRSVESRDAMTATVTKIPWHILEKIQSRIVAEITEVVKVLFDITPKPPSTIEYI